MRNIRIICQKLRETPGKQAPIIYTYNIYQGLSLKPDRTAKKSNKLRHNIITYVK